MTIGMRIRYLRKVKLRITQTIFSRELKIGRSNLCAIETDRVNVTERVLTDISEKFSVNPDWLLNGGSDDDIFMKIPEDTETARCIESLLEEELTIIFGKLDDDSKLALRNIANKIINITKNRG